MRIKKSTYTTGFNGEILEGFEFEDYKKDCLLTYFMKEIPFCEGNCGKCNRWQECINFTKCVDCNNDVSLAYFYIINELKKHKLLPEGFKMQCCRCYNDSKENDKIHKVSEE